MNDEKYDYKANDLNDYDDKSRIKNLCNEYCFNLGSSRRKTIDIFDNALKLKHFNNSDKIDNIM